MRNVTEIQRRLIALGYLAAGEDDGKFGHRSLDAYNHFRATLGKGPVVQTSMAELNADLFPEEQPAPPAPKSNPLSDKLTLIGAVINLLKGKTMTSDQITGLIRTAIIGLAAYLAGKGYIPALNPELAATIATAIVGVWSWVSNRPKTIEPMKK